jgi:phosphatidylethanolamine-binding protein (PEBP) family uncharacterized protein
MLVREWIFAVAVAMTASCAGLPACAENAFTLSSPSFKDGERLAVIYAGNNKSNPNCVGENVSPAFSCVNPREGTKSFAFLMFDPEGRPPAGVNHFVAYGISASLTGFSLIAATS